MGASGQENQIIMAVKAAKHGDPKKREQLLVDYTPFILNAASTVCNKTVTKNHDEYSIALIAFNEAINAFDEVKGSSFLGFARRVIQRRLADYYRVGKRTQKEISLELFIYDEGKLNHTWEENKADEQFQKDITSLEYQQEIQEYEQVLKKYGICFDDLVLNCPKHTDAREKCFSIAQHIIENEQLKAYLQTTRHLPLKYLHQKNWAHRRTMERHRKYIIAICLILLHDFTLFSEYAGLNKKPIGREKDETGQG